MHVALTRVSKVIVWAMSSVLGVSESLLAVGCFIPRAADWYAPNEGPVTLYVALYAATPL